MELICVASMYVLGLGHVSIDDNNFPFHRKFVQMVDTHTHKPNVDLFMRLQFFRDKSNLSWFYPFELFRLFSHLIQFLLHFQPNPIRTHCMPSIFRWLTYTSSAERSVSIS